MILLDQLTCAHENIMSAVKMSSYLTSWQMKSVIAGINQEKNIDLRVFVLSSSQTDENVNVLQLVCCWSHALCKTKKISILGITFLFVHLMSSLDGNIVPWFITIAWGNSVFYCSFLFILQGCLGQPMQAVFWSPLWFLYHFLMSVQIDFFPWVV